MGITLDQGRGALFAAVGVQAYADAVIFKSSLGTGKGDFVQALQTLSEGGVYLPEEIRQLGAAEAPNPNAAVD